jgi:hypothetical protein
MFRITGEGRCELKGLSQRARRLGDHVSERAKWWMMLEEIRKTEVNDDLSTPLFLSYYHTYSVSIAQSCDLADLFGTGLMTRVGHGSDLN